MGLRLIVLNKGHIQFIWEHLLNIFNNSSCVCDLISLHLLDVTYLFFYKIYVLILIVKLVFDFLIFKISFPIVFK